MKKMDPVTINGTTYFNERTMCEAFNISVSSYKKRRKKGMSLIEALTTPKSNHPPKVIIYKGIKYKSLVEVANAFNVPVKLLYTRTTHLKWSLEKAIETPVFLKKAQPPKKLELNGVKYESLSELCSKLNLPFSTVQSRLERGWSLEDAVFVKPKVIFSEAISVDFNGKHYQSLASLAEDYNVKKRTLQKRFKNGWSLEECVYGKKRTDKKGKKIDKMMEEILFEKTVSKRKNKGAYQDAMCSLIAKAE